MAIPATSILLIAVVTTLTSTPYFVASSTNNNHVYSPCTDTTVQRSDGFTFGIAFAARTSFFYNSSVQLSPCDRRLSLSSSGAQLSVFRPKVDEISLLTVNSSSFQPDSIGGYMVAFAGRKYAARSIPAFVANSTYIVTSFTLVLRLSAATQDLPKSVICNVHGVNPKFLEIGERMAAAKEDGGEQKFSKGAYFLGKMVWAKGYRELIDLLAKQKQDLNGFKLDVYGNGEDAHEVQSAAKSLDLNVNFMKGRDHADDSLHGYKVFVNPSVSDVLCTATAEALAMGKFVVCADHPSNDFFRSFPNCLTYKTPEEFVNKLNEAMSRDPQPLTPEERYNLSWEAATQRFMEYSELDKILATSTSESDKVNGIVRKSKSVPNLTSVVDGGLAFAHYCLTGNEFLRQCTGAVPGTRDYNKQHCKDLHLLPPQVENPIYGW